MNQKQVENSKTLFDRALRSLVGGVNSPVRSFKKVGGTPLFMKKGQGAYLTDADDNMYVDFVMSYGPHLFGHAEPSICKKINEAVSRSTCMGFSSELEIIWAEKIRNILGEGLMVRALNSGTEATMTAIRLARGITGADVIVKFAGHYHGHTDSLMVDAGSGVATLSDSAVPECAGIPKSLASLARVLPFNNENSLNQFFETNKEKVAAIILEPIMGNMGVIPPEPGFLELVKQKAKEAGALVIFDEVMTGFRVHEKSAQGLYGIEPDLSCFGKVVGGGMPLSALVGKKEYMMHLAPEGPVYQAGTLSGNPAAISAGIAMLDLIDKDNPYQKLEKISSKMQNSIQTAAKEADVPVSVQRVGSMISVFFRKEKALNADDSRNVDHDQFKRYFTALLEEGILIPPSPFEAYFVSTAHEEYIETGKFEESITRVFKRI